jgi:hypothetical protein
MQAERTAALLGARAGGSGTTEYITSGDEATFLASEARMMPELPVSSQTMSR